MKNHSNQVGELYRLRDDGAKETYVVKGTLCLFLGEIYGRMQETVHYQLLIDEKIYSTGEFFTTGSEFSLLFRKVPISHDKKSK